MNLNCNTCKTPVYVSGDCTSLLEAVDCTCRCHKIDIYESRIIELEDAIRLHRTKVQLVQTEDMELWNHLNDGDQ